MAGTAVMRKFPVLMTLWENQVQAMGPKAADEEVLQEEAVTKDVLG